MDLLTTRHLGGLNLWMEDGGFAFRVLGHFTTNQVAQRKDHRIGNFVAHGGALAFAFDQMRLKQQRQLFRHVGLFQASGLHQFIHGHGAVMQRLQQLQSARFGQRTEQAGHGGKLRHRQLLFSPGHNGSFV